MRIRESNVCDLIVIIMAATGMCGRITFSVSFHSLDCTPLKVKCRAARTLVAGKTTGYSGDLVRWFAGLNKQLQSIKLLAEHGFYSWRNFLEAARNKSANTVGEIEAGAISGSG